MDLGKNLMDFFLSLQCDIHLSWKGIYRHLFPIQGKESGYLEKVLAVAVWFQNSPNGKKVLAEVEIMLR